MWSDPEVKKQSARFERLLVRVPEAYWLVHDYGVTRPGVLILTPAGRQVDSLAVSGSDPNAEAVTLAVTLEMAAAADAAPAADALPGGKVVHLRFGLEQMSADKCAALAEAVSHARGVASAVLKDGALEVAGARLWLRPQAVEAAAQRLGGRVTCLSHREEVVEVEVLPDTPSTMAKCMAFERSDAIDLALPSLAARSIRFLLRRDADPAVDAAALTRAAGYALRAK